MVSSLSNNRAGNIAPALVVLLHCFAQTTMAHATSSPAHSPAAFASPAAWMHPTTRIDRLRLGRQETGINRRSVGRGHGMMPHMPPTLRHCRNNMQTGASFVSSLKSCMSPKAQGAPAADFELLGGRRKVKAVFTDVDGTLLGSDHQVLPQTNSRTNFLNHNHLQHHHVSFFRLPEKSSSTIRNTKHTYFKPSPAG
jgi:hypothetical protein